MSTTTLKKGFNLIGYATSPMGLGEDLRAFAAMLEYLQITFSVIDIPTDVQGRVKVTWKQMTQEDYDTSVFFMSAIECQSLANLHPQLFSQPRKKIGYFLWELPDFPATHTHALKLVDHIWCPTRFVQKAFFNRSRQLTLALPLPVVNQSSTGRKFRSELKISPKAFVVLFMFDLHSTTQRKNPQAVVRVFLEFLKIKPTAYLILKINRWQSKQQRELNWIPEHPRIKIIKETLLPGELSDLYKSSNCYLSLHRSEGFGRTLVEAMQHGLHLVSTNFSGPEDYLNADNTWLVSWSRKVVTPKDYPNLDADSWWSEPNEQHAVTQLLEAWQASKVSRNQQGVLDGAKFSHEALADKYLPILKTYL
jgi:glycosyltransferase involved in cell wall biosynthesis